MEKKETEDTLIDVEQATVLLNVKKSWIYSKVFRKEIPVIKLKGGLLRFSKFDLENWVASQKVEVRS